MNAGSILRELICAKGGIKLLHPGSIRVTGSAKFGNAIALDRVRNRFGRFVAGFVTAEASHPFLRVNIGDEFLGD
jgi:hypothetical protein